MEKKDFNLCYPIVKVKFYPGGTLEIVRKSKLKGKRKSGKREEVRYLSRRSLHRLAFLVGESAVEFKSILTLTYSSDFPVSGLTVKQNWNRMRTYLSRLQGKFDYLWFLEFQKRGAPHLHVLLSFAPSEWTRHRVAVEWSLIVSRETIDTRRKVYKVHNHPNQWELIRKEDGAKRYALKYALKTEQKKVPVAFRDVGRFWGCSRSVKDTIPAPMEKEITSAELISYLRDVGHKSWRWEWLPKHIFLVGGKEEEVILREY